MPDFVAAEVADLLSNFYNARKKTFFCTSLSGRFVRNFFIAQQNIFLH